MARIALLIGSDFRDLRCVVTDVDRMSTQLRRRGFTIRALGAMDATRAAILRAYEDLIRDAKPGDAVVIYYTGHGGRTTAGGSELTALQFIVPVDFEEAGRGDFQGITAAELSVLQMRLCDQTANVTVILDCCYAGRMSRDPRLVLKAIEPVSYETVRHHLDRQTQAGARFERVPSEGSRAAVRVVASAPEEPAWADSNGGSALTTALICALEEAGSEPVPWSTIADRLRRWMTRFAVVQRPEVEGPASRLVFSARTADDRWSLPVRQSGRPGMAAVECAALFRVEKGDEFALLRLDQTHLGPDERVGDLIIEERSGMSARGTVRFAAGWTQLPIGTRAIRIKMTVPCIRVLMPSSIPSAVRDAITSAPLISPAGSADDWDVAVHEDDDGALVLVDQSGPIQPPRAPDADGLAALQRSLTVFARAMELRRLEGDTTSPLSAEIAIEWGLVTDGVARPLPRMGALLHAGQRIFLRVQNLGSAGLFVSLVDIGVSGRIQLAFPDTPSGRALPAHGKVTLGYHDMVDELIGVKLSWPADLLPEHARSETFLVVVTSAPQSLNVIEQPDMAGSRSTSTGTTPLLEALVDQIVGTGSRAVSLAQLNPLRYDIHAVQFDLLPADNGGDRSR